MSAPLRRVLALTGLGGGMLAADLPAQAVPDESQAARVEPAYRRSPSFRIDPFRHVIVPHWGIVFSGGARLENSAFNLSDLGALKLIGDQDTLHTTDLLDAMGLVPAGSGLGGGALGETGVYLGGPIGSRIQVGLSVQGRGYGAGLLDDNAVALLRDGNGAREEFTLGRSRGAALATLEGGLHLLYRLGPIGTEDGARMTVGTGVRLVRPMFYGYAHSTVSNGGRILLSGDSIAAHFGVEAGHTPIENASEAFSGRGSGIATDFLVRWVWPTNGFAVELMVANVGRVTVERVERKSVSVDVATTRFDSLEAVIDTLTFEVRDTIPSVTVSLPRMVRLMASAWANRILQVDLAATLPAGGSFADLDDPEVSSDWGMPLAVDLNTTWRFVRTMPIRLGVTLGGYQRFGYSAGFGIEGRVLYFQAAGESLGGLFRNARGAGGRLEMGFFF